MSTGQETPNKSRIAIDFVEYDKRNGLNTREIMELVRSELSKYPGVQITIDKDAMGPPVGKPINIEISGENYDRLIGIADDVLKTIKNENIAGIQELKSDLETGKPELLVNIDRDKARRFGLSTYSIASELRTALFGFELLISYVILFPFPFRLALLSKCPWPFHGIFTRTDLGHYLCFNLQTLFKGNFNTSICCLFTSLY